MKIKAIIKSDFFPFLFCLSIGLSLITFNVIGLKFSHYPGDLGDGRLNNYFLEHAYKFLSFQEKSLWNAPFMFPEKNVLTYSDNLLGTVPFYSVFRILNFNRETSYQLWYILMIILSYSACYYLLKLLFKNSYSAAIGAMVFAFSIALQSQLTHAQTFPRFPIPLAFVFLLLFSREFNPKYFFLTVFMVVYQLYCGIYLGLMLMIPISIMFINIILFYWKNISKYFKNLKWLGLILFSLVINILIALPLIMPYIERSKMLQMNTYDYVFPTIPSIISHFYSQGGSLIWDFLSRSDHNIPAFWDHQIFAGGLATLALISFLILNLIKPFLKNKLTNFVIDKNLMIISLTSILTFLLFLRIDNFSMYWIVHKIPGFASMRSITRIINIELIFFAISVAYFVTHLLKRYNKMAFFIFLAFVSIFMTDNYFKGGKVYRSEKQITQIRVQALIEKMKNIPENSIVSYEPADGKSDCIVYQLDAMLATQSLNLISVNAYTATSPGTFTDYWNNLDSISRIAWFKSNNLKDPKVYVVH
jgi:hypothetical protein